MTPTYLGMAVTGDRPTDWHMAPGVRTHNSWLREEYGLGH